MPLKLVRRHGSPNWYLRGTVARIAVDESTGLAERSDAEALKARREWELVQQAVHGRRVVATFLEAAVGYMEAGGERRFLTPLIDHFAAMPLEHIGQAEIDRAARLLYPGGKPATLNRQVYTPVSAILRHAARRALCAPRILERPREPKARIRWLTPAEAGRLVAAAGGHLKPLLTFLLYTGARLSEALYLDWRDVDLARAEVRFVATKNGTARGVPLHGEALTALANLAHRRGAVFRRPDGKPYARKASAGGGQIKTGFAAACRRAGIADFRPHDCRHTFATWHYAANRDLARLMELCGWRSERMALRYAHLNVAGLAPSIAALPHLETGGSTGATVRTTRKKPAGATT